MANTLRRIEGVGAIPADVAAMAHDALNRLHIDFYPYEPFADRIWELRHNVTSYDALYIALGEALDAPVATLDQRLMRTPGTVCEFATPIRS